MPGSPACPLFVSPYLAAMLASWSVILPAAGIGQRFGGDVPKQYFPLSGRPIIVHTVDRALALPSVSVVVIAVAPLWRERTAELLAHAGLPLSRVAIVDGGTDRQASIAAGLDHPAVIASSVVLVHDAVRPAATADLFIRVATAAARDGAAVPVVPVVDTIKVVDMHGRVLSTPERDTLRAAQTPQGFRPTLLREAYAWAAANAFRGTDDASVVEAFGHTVVCVDGSPSNIKITTYDDLRRMSSILAQVDRHDVEQ